MNLRNIARLLHALASSFLYHRKYPKIPFPNSVITLYRDSYGVPHIKAGIWGLRNKCQIRHRFGRYITFLNYPSIETSGGRHTISPVHKFGHQMDDAGSAWRQIIDLANLDNSLCILAGGQSGHRFNKNWRDQLKLWANFRYKHMTLGARSVELRAESMERRA